MQLRSGKRGTERPLSPTPPTSSNADNASDTTAWRIVDVEHDNACFYHAVARQTRLSSPSRSRRRRWRGKADNFREARETHAQITQWVVDNWDAPLHCTDPALTVGDLAAISHDSQEARDSAAYRATYALQYSVFARDIDANDRDEMPWGGAVEQYAAAQLYERCVEIYVQQHNPSHRRRKRRKSKTRSRARAAHLTLYQCFAPPDSSFTAADPIRLLYCESGAHYKSIES